MTEPKFTVLIDKEESRRWPYSFPARTVVVELPAGSYSIQGFDQHLAIKRVTAEQLFAGCGTNRDQFIGELERLAEIPTAYLVLETTLEGIFNYPPPESRMRPKAVASSLVAWVNRYALMLWPCSSREAGEKWTWAILRRWWSDGCEGAMYRSAERRARRMARDVMKQFPQPVAQRQPPHDELQRRGQVIAIGVG